MKKCSYCGADYPDDFVVCPVDQTPFDGTQLTGKPRVAPVAPAIKREIPTSLSVVSYLYFACGVWIIAFDAFIVSIGGPIQPNIIAGVLAVLISRGLRRCSRPWRICALFFIWLGFALISFELFEGFSHAVHLPDTAFLLTYGFSFPLQIWQYRVLTRPDIRGLFYDDHRKEVNP